MIKWRMGTATVPRFSIHFHLSRFTACVRIFLQLLSEAARRHNCESPPPDTGPDTVPYEVVSAGKEAEYVNRLVAEQEACDAATLLKFEPVQSEYLVAPSDNTTAALDSGMQLVPATQRAAHEHRHHHSAKGQGVDAASKAGGRAAGSNLLLMGPFQVLRCSTQEDEAYHKVRVSVAYLWVQVFFSFLQNHVDLYLVNVLEFKKGW